MKVSFYQLLSVLLLLSTSAWSKNLGLAVSFTEYMSAEDEAYLELHFALDARTLDFYKTADQQWTGGLEITASLHQDSNIVSADKFRIKLSPQADTSAFQQTLVQQTRLPLASGEHKLRLQIINLADPTDTLVLQQLFTPQLEPGNVAAAAILPLSDYTKADGQSSFSKSGYELVPLVTSGSYFFDDSQNKLSFYTEVYNTKNVLGDSAAYLLQYYLRDANSQSKLNDYASFKKKNTSEVEPLLASFNIEDLPSGNYELVVEALDQQGEELFSNQMFFYRQNTKAPLVAGEVSSEELNSSFVSQMTYDSLDLFIRYLGPISSPQQERYQKNLLAQRDEQMMRSYLYSFWQNQNQQDPGAAWQEYKQQVQYVNNTYSSSLSAGYETDRGRVYLKYGPPSMSQKRVMEPGLPPYALWQYGQIDSPYAIPQVNKMFVFADVDPGTRIFELIHSTAIGEKFSNRWRQELAYKYRGGQINADQTGYSDQDDWGSRINDNLILQGTGADQNRRFR